MEEEWRSVPNYEGFYEVSNFGRVRSVERMVNGRNGKPHRSGGHVVVPGEAGSGYLAVNLSCNGKSRMRYVHRLVASAFICNPKEKPEVNHIDGNKKNNYACNLEWVDKSENALHAYKNGLNHKAGGTPPKKIVVTNGDWRKVFDSIADAATYCQISQSSISRSCSGKFPYFKKTYRAYYL